MNKRRRLTLFVFALLAGMAALVSPVAAQDPQPTPSDDEVNRVAKQMYCPVCENIPLDVCPTQACTEWRELIRLRLSEGWSDEQIKSYFASQYGDRVLAEPPRRGLNWLVYIMPVVFFLAGGYILFRVMTAMKRSAPQTGAAGGEPGAPAETPDDPYLARLEEELKKKD